jgi:hypothetical protein
VIQNHLILDKKIYQSWLQSISHGFNVLGLHRNEEKETIEILVRLYTNAYELNKEKYQEMKFLNLIQTSNRPEILQNVRVLRIEDPRHRNFFLKFVFSFSSVLFKNITLKLI